MALTPQQPQRAGEDTLSHSLVAPRLDQAMVRETPHARNPSEECAGGSHTCMVIFSGVTSHGGGK